MVGNQISIPQSLKNKGYTLNIGTDGSMPDEKGIYWVDAESFAVESDSELIRAMHTYKEFLAGSLTIDDANMEEIFFEGGDFSKFTLFDINWDSMPELHIRTPRYYGIFTYANDETRMIHDGSAYDDLLEDGTLLYTKIDDTPPHVAYRHKRFNTDGNLAEDIAFDQWDRDGNGEYDGKDVYCFDGRAVSFEQWVDLTGWRLSLDSNMKWMDYSAWLFKEQGEFRRNRTNRTPTPQEIMQKYNGSGDLAVKYGAVTNEYYKAFKEYNGR